VLFADVTGFTRLVESAEPETVYEVVHALMHDLVIEVHRHRGEVQQVLGDGFMAVFGLRSEPGDEARRAVRAGLALVGAGETGRLPVHVGIECGEVLVTPAWESAGFGVWGRAVNLAKRLCDLAGPGEIQVGPATYARTGQDLSPALPVPVRLEGMASPVVAYQLGPDTRPPACQPTAFLPGR
jgi:class 3 adenylate cyclase